MLATLTGCAGSGPARDGRINLANVPPDIRKCLAESVPAPLPGSLSRQDAAALIAALKQSEFAKSQCGKRLIAWYEAQAKALRR